jgi:hypothetical protein
LFIPGERYPSGPEKQAAGKTVNKFFFSIFLTGLACSLLSLIMPIAPDFLGREK